MIDCQRHLFDIPDTVSYLNCAYMAPQLRAVSAAGQAAVTRKSAPWTIGAPDFFEPAEALRSLFARIVGGDADGVAVVPAASYGLSLAAANLPVGPGRTVVVLDEQFPSHFYPWQESVRRDGGELVTVTRPTSGGWTEAILDRIDRRTAIVAVPQCHWTDGSPVDLEQVSRASREVGAAFVIDGSQSIGAHPLDVAELEPDFVVAVGYKWLLGPYGSAYLWAAPHRRHGVPLEHGWMTREKAEDFSSLVMYRDGYQAGARRYDAGQFGNFITIPMLTTALEQILAWGVDALAGSLGRYTNRIADVARDMGFVTPEAPQRMPHMIGVRIPGGAPESLGERLREADIYVSIRGDSVRISPHVYNTDDDVDRLLEVLARVRP